ncbi:cytoplasmic protein [Bacillus thuringiensis]|uniref:TerD family protein n=1 Tax=Bacillus thuringiensis TaxID=1428 RepID=UPI00080F5A26|nr:TerD family protein [Bacillus thuringiensis]ANV71386.1 cytoplasmic protein [Bacillus thuringiensis]
MKNSIYIRRSLKVIIKREENKLPNIYLATVLKNLESLGFTFSEPLIEELQTLSVDAFTSFYKELVKHLKEMVGAHIQFTPMYPNFPQQMMDLSDADLYINAIIHYVTLRLPVSKVEERLPLLDRVDLKVIDLGSEEDFNQMISQLISANSSISSTDKTDVEWAITHTEDVSCFLPNVIPHKENMSFIIGVLLINRKISADAAAKYFKTATDVHRLAVALSEGDVSLASSVRFKKFNRAERRFLLGLLEQCGNITEDMLRYKKRWIRLGEILHPAEYHTRFPKTHRAFEILRNNIKVETFNGKIEAALLNRDIMTAKNLLKTRPGEFARRLDHLIRLCSDKSTDVFNILEDFLSIIGNVSTPVLLQLTAHFKHRNDKNEFRTFFPKGNVAKAIGIENTLPFISEDICLMIVKMCEDTLKNRFAELPSLGKVFLDEQLKNHLVPFSQRSASKALRTLSRGSKVDLPEGDTIRFFLWWKEGYVNGQHTGRVDIDLSAAMYDEDWQYKEHVSFTNLRSKNFKAYHSGDITSAPKGASEFIDFDIPSVLKYGARYVVMTLLSYTDQPYKDLPECFTGWMVRQYPGSGEIFEPSTVQDKVDITADTQISIPVILDLKERKLIWTDLSLTRDLTYDNTIEANQKGMILVGKALTNLVKPNLYDLFRLHIEARGELVQDIEEAESIFSLDKGITPFDIEKIISDFIADSKG